MSYLKKYEYLIAVKDNGGISGAAEKLGISQPTFSKYVKKIESELGIELIDRSTLPIRLTEAGECFVNAGKKLIDLDRQLEKQLSELKNRENSLVRVGISPSRSQYTMPGAIELYRRRNPDGRIVIEERTTAELCRRLREGELDLIVSILDKDTEMFERVDLFDESILLAAPADICEEGADASELLKSASLISVGKGQVMWQTLNKMLEEQDGARPGIECQSIESALCLVKRGLGVTLVPSYIARASDERIRFLSVSGAAGAVGERRVCVFYRKEQFLTRAERDFIDCITQSEKERG